MTKVSVIVPVYKVEQYLQRCVDSILNQTFSDFELILVDDGSPDKCPSICDDYAKKDNRITVIHKKNGGLSDARNAGLKIAKGEYIYFLDSDDYIDSRLLEKTVNAMIENNVDMVIFNFYSVKDDKYIEPFSVWHENGLFDLTKDDDKIYFLFQKLLSKGIIGWEAWGRLFKADIIKKYNLFFEDNNIIFAEDLYFCLCYAAHSQKIMSIEDYLYFYRVRSSSIMAENRNKSNLKRMSILFEAVTKHYNMNTDCTFMKKYYPLLYFYIIEHDMKNVLLFNKMDIKQIRKLLFKEIENFSELKNYFRKLYLFKKELSDTYGDYVAQEKINSYKYFCNGNYISLSLKNRLLYRKGYKTNYNSKIIDEEKIKTFSAENNKVYYLCTEEFGNVGDHKINDAIIAFLENSGFKVFEVTLPQYYSSVPILEKYIKKEDLIVLPGGGNITDVYEGLEQGKHDVITRWKENRKVIFPQTVFYTDTEKGKNALNKAKEMYSNENNVVLFTRENVSYEFSKRNFNCDIHLVPDIVLNQNECDDTIRNDTVLLCLRSDLEGVISSAEKDLIFNSIKSLGLNAECTDLQMKCYISKNKRKSVVTAYLNLWKTSKLVITDRLHGFIFAAITGTPCIAISNYNQKIKGTYGWISYLPYVKFAENAETAVAYIPELLKIENSKYDKTPLMPYFEELADIIKD